MAAKRHKQRNKRLPLIPLLAICAVVFLNLYALHELMIIADSWKAKLLPGSIAMQLIQLAAILAINSVGIVYLLIDRLNR